jgi:hypothetical protein
MNATAEQEELAELDGALAELEEFIRRHDVMLNPQQSLVKLLSENMRLTTKAGGQVSVWVQGKTRIQKVGVSLGDDLQLSMTTPKSGKWRVLNTRGFNASGTIPHVRGLAIITKIFQIAAE